MFILNTLRLRHNDRNFPDDIFKCIFFNENIWISIKISMKFVPNGPNNIHGPAVAGELFHDRQTSHKSMDIQHAHVDFACWRIDLMLTLFAHVHYHYTCHSSIIIHHTETEAPVVWRVSALTHRYVVSSWNMMSMIYFVINLLQCASYCT